MPISELSSAWTASPLVLAAAFVALVRFGQAFVRLRRRGRVDHAGWGRATLFVLGLAVVTMPVVSPVDAAGDSYLLSAHMLEHMLIGDAGPALLLVAVRGPLLSFMIPAPLARAVLHLPPLHRLLGLITRPAVALVLWVVAFTAWHLPTAYDYALGHPVVHDVEHASFVTVGLLVWMQLVDPARRRRLSVGQKVAFAGLLFAFGQILSDVLFLVPNPLYPAYAAPHPRLFGISPLSDQQYAGLVMMAEQLLTLGTCITIVVVASLRRPQLRPVRINRPVPQG